MASLFWAIILKGNSEYVLRNCLIAVAAYSIPNGRAQLKSASKVNCSVTFISDNSRAISKESIDCKFFILYSIFPHP